MVRTGEGYDPLLRRPLSIHRVAPLSSPTRLALLFTVVGRGTKWLAERGEGDMLDIRGPLGRWVDPLITLGIPHRFVRYSCHRCRYHRPPQLQDSQLGLDQSNPVVQESGMWRLNRIRTRLHHHRSRHRPAQPI